MSDLSRILLAVDAVEKKLTDIYSRLAVIEEGLGVLRERHKFVRNSLVVVLAAVAGGAVTHFLP